MPSRTQIGEDGKAKLEATLLKLNLPPAVAAELSEHRTVVTYPKGAMLFLQDSAADLLFCVLSGFVGVYSPAPNGNRILVRLVGPGEVAGHQAVLDKNKRLVHCFEVQARSKCEVALISRDNLASLLDKRPQEELVNYAAVQDASWSSSLLQWISTMGLDYRPRLERLLAELGERFGVKDSRGTLIIPDLSHDDFAEMIGCSRPMATKLITEMVETGRIRRHGRQYILANRLGAAENVSASRAANRSREAAYAAAGG